MSAIVFGVLLDVIRSNGDRFDPGAKNTVRENLPRIMPSLQLIDRRIDDAGVSVADLAATAGVGEVYLRKLFHRVVGVSPVAFLQRRRVEESCRLLRTTDLSIKAIAARSAFSDLPFFYRVFRKWTKATTGSYRQNLRA